MDLYHPPRTTSLDHCRIPSQPSAEYARKPLHAAHMVHTKTLKKLTFIIKSPIYRAVC